MLALPYTACKYKRYQLRMCAISHSKHTKLKNTKIYSKGVLASHTKISTNENFPLYGIFILHVDVDMKQIGNIHVSNTCTCTCTVCYSCKTLIGVHGRMH